MQTEPCDNGTKILQEDLDSWVTNAFEAYEGGAR